MFVLSLFQIHELDQRLPTHSITQTLIGYSFNIAMLQCLQDRTVTYTTLAIYQKMYEKNWKNDLGVENVCVGADGHKGPVY